MNKIKQFLKEIFEIEKLPDSELYILLGIFALIIVLGISGLI
jgi:hypothetical protein